MEGVNSKVYICYSLPAAERSVQCKAFSFKNERKIQSGGYIMRCSSEGEGMAPKFVCTVTACPSSKNFSAVLFIPTEGFRRGPKQCYSTLSIQRVRFHSDYWYSNPKRLVGLVAQVPKGLVLSVR